MIGIEVLAVIDRLIDIAVEEWTGFNDRDMTPDNLLTDAPVARAEVAELIAERDALRVVANDFSEVMREKGFRCECGEDDCRTTRLDAVLARIGREA